MSLHFILQHGNAALYIVHVFIFTFFVLFFGFFKIFAQIYFLLFFIIFKVYQTDIVFVSSMYVLFLHVSLICFLIKSFILEIFHCFFFFFRFVLFQFFLFFLPILFQQSWRQLGNINSSSSSRKIFDITWVLTNW